MTAKETRSAVQSLLNLPSPDGDIGPITRAAFERLANAPAESEWPPPHVAMSDRFLAFIDWILDHEGRYFEDDPFDSGGRTHYGVDQRSHPGVDIRNLTEAGAIEIYWHEWLQAGCESMQTPYAETYFNAAINMGIGRAKEFDAAAKGNAGKFLDLQEAKYHSIAANNRNLARYLSGWLNRTADLRTRFGIA